MSYQALRFRNAAQQLQILDTSLSFSSLQAIVGDRLPLLVQEMRQKQVDLDDPSCWWEALLIDQVIVLENSQGKRWRVAVSLSDCWKVTQKTLRVVKSHKFQQLRLDLGIDRHWIVYIERRLLSVDEWCDLLYENIDRKSASDCTVIEV